MQRKIISMFWRTAWKHPKLALTSLFFGPSTLLLERYVAPLFIAQFFDHIQKGNASLENTWILVVGYLILQLYSQVIGFRVTLHSVWKLINRGSQDLYQLCFEKVMGHSAAFHADTFSGALVAQIAKFTGSFDRFWNLIIYRTSFLAVSIAATIIGVAFISYWFAVVLFLLCLCFLVAAFFGTRHMRKLTIEESSAKTLITAQTADSITNVMAVKSFGHNTREYSSFKQTVRHWADKDDVERTGFLQVSSIYAAILAFMKISAMVTAVLLVQQQTISAAAVFLCLTYTFNLVEEIWQFNNMLRDYYRIIADSSEMMTILSQELEIKDSKNASRLIVKKGIITFDAVTFEHDKDSPLFKDFNLSIKPGEKIGLVGHSGAGKSTITNLILRFMDISSGHISIDGQDITTVSQESLRKNIAYVPQEPLLFHRSLRENITYGKTDATEDEIIDATRKAHALEFIEKLPDGFDTLVGERGVKLSGGQRQRVAIARAILKDAPILILDEATSALDSESEKLIQDALGKLMKNRTSIVIAHRLSTIAKLDRIIVLENGKIIEDGSHQDLLKKKGMYATLWSHQSGGFIEE